MTDRRGFLSGAGCGSPVPGLSKRSGVVGDQRASVSVANLLRPSDDHIPPVQIKCTAFAFGICQGSTCDTSRLEIGEGYKTPDPRFLIHLRR